MLVFRHRRDLHMEGEMSDLDCADTHDLGPNQLQWLRDHIPQFKKAEEAARAVREMVEANRRGMETST